jgi:hypothetical protein
MQWLHYIANGDITRLLRAEHPVFPVDLVYALC